MPPKGSAQTAASIEREELAVLRRTIELCVVARMRPRLPYLPGVNRTGLKDYMDKG